MQLNTDNPNSYHYETTHLSIEILGGIRLNHLDRLRVTISIQKQGTHLKLRHNLDLYNDTQVEKLVRKIAERLEIGTSVVRRTIQDLINELETYRISQLAELEADKVTVKTLTKAEEKEALKLLKSKNLLEETNKLIGKSGVIGEVNNRLLMYIIFTSRKANNPLHCMSLGSSGAGKTHLQSKVAELIPEEDKVEITVLSENAFYYFNRTELQYKLILIEDLDGAGNALYAIRELQSKHKITKTVVHKDTRGNTKTIHLTVEGPVCIAGCTTQESIYEDNSNRSFLLYIDESEEQDERIMQYQRLISAGKVHIDQEHTSRDLLQNAQRCLKNISVRNPYAESLKLPNAVFKPRRTNAHYLQFIEAVTFYHQHQREKKYDEETGEEYIETTIEDIKEANKLLQEVLLRKSDTITGACRNYFEKLKNYLKEHQQTTFTNKQISILLRIPLSTVKRYHLQLINTQRIQLREKDKTGRHLYEITNYEEYQQLKKTIATVLDEAILQL
ncbi:hypothetical protein [Polaribacter cellanae]|uniref:Uncharacterized protein n=1 Tax=Polaribacter cellanae TaxID=2818493 RepID=A0A975CK18_9FLAO|nr:hypothetical protein [Polaribacter cellanae]QTE21183.1 hypothetical protein J3359_10040 [Polaribacter cellanae]QTE21193.1 hypothetical protein J3359_10090 [Polaribacter cellanae]